LFFGRTGRKQKPPPQFGQTLCRTISTQERQKVHSNEQIIASVDSGRSGMLQFSQVGLNSSMVVFRWWRVEDADDRSAAFTPPHCPEIHKQSFRLCPLGS